MFEAVDEDTRTSAGPPSEGDVVRRLISHLLSDKVQAGTKLAPERELCTSLGCNRAALREAISQLSFLGILSSRQGAGTYFRGVSTSQLPDIIAWITQFSDTDVTQVIDARWSYEVMSVGLAAQRHTSAQLRQLGTRLAAMRDAADRQEFAEADTEFHRLLVQSSDNTVLATLGEGIHAVTHLWIGRNLAQLSDHTLPYPEHHAIFDAVARRDPDAAQQAMHLHMAHAVRRLRSTMAEEVHAAVVARGREYLVRAGLPTTALELPTEESAPTPKGERP